MTDELERMSDRIRESEYVFADIIAEIPKHVSLMGKHTKAITMLMEKMSDLEQFCHALFASQQLMLSLLVELDPEFHASFLEALENTLNRTHEFDNPYTEKILNELLQGLQSNTEEPEPQHTWTPVVIKGKKTSD
jgi:hypothetical protein